MLVQILRGKGNILEEFQGISDVIASCIPNHLLLESYEKNYIISLQPGQTLVIHNLK